MLTINRFSDTSTGATLALAAVLACGGLAGCGASGGTPTTSTAKTPIGTGQRGVLETVDALQAASRSGDGKKICDEVFTSELAASIKVAAGHSCSKEVRERLFTPDAAFSVGRDIRIAGRTAEATIREQDDTVSTLSLRQVAGRWQIARITPKEAS